MKRVVAAISVASAMLLTTGTFAQERRNFSGAWTIDGERMLAIAGASGGVARSGGGGGGAIGAAGPTMRSGGGGGGRGGGGGGRGGGGGTMAAMTPPAIGALSSPGSVTIDLTATAVTLSNGTAGTAYQLDGSAVAFDTARGSATSKGSWKADKFVIETTTSTITGPSTTVSSWYLETDSLVNELVTTNPGTDPVTRKTFYKRKV